MGPDPRRWLHMIDDGRRALKRFNRTENRFNRTIFVLTGRISDFGCRLWGMVPSNRGGMTVGSPSTMRP